jgi:hypothetical protein
MATAVDPNLPPLFSNIRYSLKQTIKEPAKYKHSLGVYFDTFCQLLLTSY